MIKEEIIKKIENGPAVLLVGQKYLSLTSKKNSLLEKIVSKFQRNDIPIENNILNYDLLLKLGLNNKYEAASTWIENLCNNISVPEWLERISRVSWSSVYTTSIDTIVDRAFSNEWRKVQPVNDEKFRIIDPRNKFNLHIVHLFGSISQVELSKRPPFSLSEKAKRKFSSNALLQKLPEVITNKGVLIIDGYDENDWLTIEELYAVISRMGTEQVLFFSSNKEIESNHFIEDLITSNKILMFENSFAQVLSDLEGTDKIKLITPEPDEYYGKWINIGTKKIKIPQDLINRISKTATIIDEGLFYSRGYSSLDEKYSDFKNFLSSTNSSNHWKGYYDGFAFKRDYYDSLKKIVLDKVNSSRSKEVPTILFGQSSSGKSVTLGMLAYDLSQIYKIPVLYIEKRYQKIDELDIDKFCGWAEDNDAKNTIVIWDGMVDPDLYFSLLKKLNTRGRNVILIGSTYDNGKFKSNDGNFIESPIALTSNEKRRFVEYLKNIDVLLGNLISNLEENNFLAMLYRYLPVTRDSIKKGLKSEFEFFSKKLRETKLNTSVSSGSMFSALVSAGLVNENEVSDMEALNVIDGEEINLSDLLIFSIMVPGQFALNVPYELLLRTIGFESLSSNLFKELNEVDLITWTEDSQGNVLLGPRTAIEAKILCQYLGGKKAEIEYIKLLLKQVQSYDYATFGYGSNTEIQFAVELLNNISPNITESYKDRLYEITEVLKELRESRHAYHPRLILKEASFLRELVTDKERKNFVELSPQELLERAEIIVREALEQLQNYRERTIVTYLKVELASILGTRAYEYVNDRNHVEEAKTCYELVKQVNNYEFASNPENYNLLDVLAWTTEKLIKENIFNEIEKINAEAEMIHLFEMAETEGISEQNIEKFNVRRMNFYELMGKQKLADAVFDNLAKQGFASGYYIKAKQIMDDFDTNKNITNDDFVKRSTETAKYLQSVYEKIKEDGKCLYLLLKTWWVMKSKFRFFESEKQALPFSKNDWEYCTNLLEKLSFIGGIYHSATIIYLKAIAQFHTGHIRESLDAFRILDTESDFSAYGKRRIVKSYLVSTPEGKPKLFNGEVKRTVSFQKNDRTGDIYISELRQSIPFNLNEFNKSEYQEGESIDKFYIGFNFRGPIAVPLKS
ncbi:hypothetical protein EGI15_21085 [Chryseobacterium cucumeris]|uniref:SIR2-like domain-containing protein n=1 Tax=Chryseobacterium cucumeris TaxID=1813611 RepID=A0ABX9X306_9FLAO|nr:SIR2 family protein [Chryseobacterium cucumeris]ROH87517.1 hypothetical protein EGI15_21085 [Chryseobacterium cucumeris]